MNILLMTNGKKSLIARVDNNRKVFEYVVGSDYDPKEDRWRAGWYFSDLQEALDYFKAETEEGE